MNTIRWGIIGCGNVTEVKSGPGFSKADNSRLVAVMRRDAALAQDYARRHNIPRWYASADELLSDPEVDAVYIATPPGSHEHYAMRVLATGKPCYVEKPMARNAAEARRMVDAFHARKVPLFVAYYRRALPRFLKVKKLIDDGALGRLQSVTFTYTDGKMSKRESPIPWRLEGEQAGAGLFFDMGSHAVDLLDFWLGPIQLLSAQAKNLARIYDVEDHVEFTFRNAAGVSGALTCSFSTDPHDEFVVKGDRAEARLSCFGNEPVRLIQSDGPTESLDLPNPPHVAQPLIQTVVNDLLGMGKCPSTGDSGLRAQRLLDQAVDAYYGGREDGFWARPWPGSPRNA